MRLQLNCKVEGRQLRDYADGIGGASEGMRAEVDDAPFSDHSKLTADIYSSLALQNVRKVV